MGTHEACEVVLALADRRAFHCLEGALVA
jgi:hypothetical protein